LTFCVRLGRQQCAFVTCLLCDTISLTIIERAEAKLKCDRGANKSGRGNGRSRCVIMLLPISGDAGCVAMATKGLVFIEPNLKTIRASVLPLGATCRLPAPTNDCMEWRCSMSIIKVERYQLTISNPHSITTILASGRAIAGAACLPACLRFLSRRSLILKQNRTTSAAA
jgi:hypothetical protein